MNKMTNVPTATQVNAEASVVPPYFGGQPTRASSMVNAVDRARQNYSNVVHQAANAELRILISGLIEARRTHNLDDESFSKVMEYVLGQYFENKITATVENILSKRFFPIFDFGTSDKK